jgi:hypothetical protein
VRLIGRAHKTFTFTALNYVQEESEKDADITTTILLNQYQAQLLVLVDLLALL